MLTHHVRRIALAATLALPALGAAALLVPGHAFAAGDEKPAKPAKSEDEQLRARWEAKITFFGEEETGNWSLRVQDQAAPTEATKVKYLALWKVNPETKRWVKIDNGAATVTIVPANQKPGTAPPDSQLIADLPLRQNDVGLYYAQWRINDGVEGATMTRIGPGLVGAQAKEAKDHPVHPPKGMIAAIVPININKAELMIVPDPRFNMGQNAQEAPKK